MKKICFKQSLLLVLLMFSLFTSAQWTSNTTENTLINDKEGEQVLPKIVVNSNGESYISFMSDPGNLNFSVYLQKLDPEGNKLWAEDGLLISDHATDTWVTDYDLVLDNEEYPIMVNQDRRTGTSNVYAYRISPTGQFMWGPDGVALTNDPDFDPSPKAIALDDGGAIFAWSSDPEDTTEVKKNKIGLQRLSGEGNKLWGDGIVLDSTVHFFSPKLLLTEDNNFILSWLSIAEMNPGVPGEEDYMHVRAQKFDLDGNAVWPYSVQVDTGNIMLWAALYTEPFLENDMNGGAYIVWQSFYEYEPNILTNHIDSDGTLTWGGGGIPVSTNSFKHHEDVSLCYNTDCNALYIGWIEYENPGGVDCFGVYGQVFSPAGERLWGDEGIEIVPLACTIDSAYFDVEIQNSIDSSIMVCYGHEYLDIVQGDTMLRVDYYALGLDHFGDRHWGPITLSDAASSKLRLAVSELFNDQWITAWSDSRSDPGNDFADGIYAQNIYVDGSVGPLDISESTLTSEIRATCFPNPGNGATTISYRLEHNALVKIYISDVQGRLVETLCSAFTAKGEYMQVFDAGKFDAGVYFYTIEVAGESFTQKLIITK